MINRDSEVIKELLGYFRAKKIFSGEVEGLPEVKKKSMGYNKRKAGGNSLEKCTLKRLRFGVKRVLKLI